MKPQRTNVTSFTYIKSWADALTNLLIEQGGFPEREMWPKGNYTYVSPPRNKPKEGFFMSKINNTKSTPTPKPVFARLTPEMSREEKIRNLKAALEKSGIKIVDDKPHTNN